MSFENLQLEREGALATVTMNRPDVRNALDSRTIDELRRAVLELRHDAGTRAVIITGAGDRAFAAGADISELARLEPGEAKAYSLAGQHVFDLIENLGKPVIAAVNGAALGGGCELAMACTFRLAADTASFGQPEVKLGLIPGFGGTQRLPRLVGRAAALDLILTGRRIDASEALRLGLVHRVTPAPSLMGEAHGLAASLAEQAPTALRLAMEAINRGTEIGLPQGEFLEATLFALAAATEDMREGARAFLDKRQPRFTGK